MTDDERAELLGQDLREFMLRTIPPLDSDVYAISVWMSWDGALAVNLGSEAAFQRSRNVPAYREVPDDQLRSPAGLRWSSGDWEVVAADFMSAGSERAMRPLFRAMSGEGGGKLEPDAATERVLRIGIRALRRMGTLPELRAADSAIAFVELDDVPVVDNAAFLVSQLPAQVLRPLFPHWERLADRVRAVRADPEALARLQALVDLPREQRTRFPQWFEPAADPLTAALRDCGLWWQDVTTDSDALRTGLTVAAKLAGEEVRPGTSGTVE